jgi:hypothetical protein
MTRTDGTTITHTYTYRGYEIVVVFVLKEFGDADFDGAIVRVVARSSDAISIDARTTAPLAVYQNHEIADLTPDTDVGEVLDKGYELGCAEIESRINGLPKR